MITAHDKFGVGQEVFMFDKYKFEEIEAQNCFEHGVVDILYFPITNKNDFPKEIRDKAEEMINDMIQTYKLDISQMRLNARIIVFCDKEGSWKKEISIVIADDGIGDLIEKSYSVECRDALYKPFKEHFMKQLENLLML